MIMIFMCLILTYMFIKFQMAFLHKVITLSQYKKYTLFIERKIIV